MKGSGMKGSDMAQASPLHEEHVLLGASFSVDGTGVERPVNYAAASADSARLKDGALLADMGGMTSLLVSGHGCGDFVGAAMAGRRLAVGETAFEAALVGDGTVASIPLMARTGTEEFALWDLTPRGETLFAWLSFVIGIGREGVRPYEGVAVEDVSERLVPLCLCGAAAQRVLSDYLRDEERLPEEGRVADVRLDGRIATLVASLRLSGETHCYLVMVPPTLARAVWRSLLSFGEVSPAPPSLMTAAIAGRLPWLAPASTLDRLELDAAFLARHGLVREGRDYIGARGLLD